MSACNVTSHPRFAKTPVSNPPMRPGPKPRGTLSFSAARAKRDRLARLMKLEQAQECGPGPLSGVTSEAFRTMSNLADALIQKDRAKLQQFFDRAMKMIDGKVSD